MNTNNILSTTSACGLNGQQTLPEPYTLCRLAAHALGGPLQRFVAELHAQCLASPPLMGLLSAHLAALWAAHPETAQRYLDTWERLLLYGDPSNAGTEAAASEVRALLSRYLAANLVMRGHPCYAETAFLHIDLCAFPWVKLKVS